VAIGSGEHNSLTNRARENFATGPLPAVGRYLRAWGFTAQRPMRWATERQDEAVRIWLESTYPTIARRARAQGCEIQWTNETGLSNRANYGRSFAPRGQTQGSRMNVEPAAGAHT
jgi:Winged helix-turn helix